ncbi:MAG: preprotein translocase subunit YajC [Alphaproteobacteria bacterium]|nr:MAG: preprotein translocase subunit YajC [Alphaproteobacteria bacterium]
MWISTALAQTAGGAGGAQGGLAQMLVPLLLVFAIFYFLIIRPQNKRLKAHREMVAAVKRGDTIVTSGGLIGKVTKVTDDEVEAEIADGVRVHVVKGTIAEVRPKGQPVKADDAKK